MENDSGNLINYKEEIIINNSYQVDYEGQNYENNISFKNWRESNLKKFGKDAKLFKCIKDKIFFYASNNEYSSFPYYVCKCPICNKSICYYCQRYVNKLQLYRYCCLKRMLKLIFLHSGLMFINKNEYINLYNQRQSNQNDNDADINFNKDLKMIIFLLIPGFNLIFFIGLIQHSFLGVLSIKYNNNEEKFYTYEELYKNHIDLVEIINILSVFTLGITLLIIDIYFILLILLLSIPFKFYPIRYIWGVIHAFDNEVTF